MIFLSVTAFKLIHRQIVIIQSDGFKLDLEQA